MFTIKRANCLRYLTFRGKQISSIRIFDPETKEVVHSEDSGWFSQGYGKDTEVIVFDNECKLKRKLDLSLKEPFFIKDNEIGYSRETRYVLYIPTTICNYKSLGEEVKYETDTETYYHNFCEIDLVCQLGDGEIKKQTLKLSQHSKIVENSFGKEVKKWEEKLKEDNISISNYDLKELLSKYKLVRK
jgi:hypothetical protein